MWTSNKYRMDPRLSTSHTSTDNMTGQLTDSKNSVFLSPLVSVSRPFLARSSSGLYVP